MGCVAAAVAVAVAAAVAPAGQRGAARRSSAVGETSGSSGCLRSPLPNPPASNILVLV